MNAHATRYTLIATFVATSLAACGGAAPPSARAPESAIAEPEGDPATVEEAQEQIARAQARLGGPGRSADAPAGADAAPPAKPAPAPPAEPMPDARPGAATKSGVGDGMCSNRCRALASMRRAVGALCRMTGDTDGRCLDAKRTLADNEGRIAPPCTC